MKILCFVGIITINKIIIVFLFTFIEQIDYVFVREFIISRNLGYGIKLFIKMTFIKRSIQKSIKI